MKYAIFDNSSQRHIIRMVLVTISLVVLILVNIASAAQLPDKELENDTQIQDNAITIDPQNATAWYDKGVNSNILGKYEESIEAFDTAIEINPQNSNAWNGKGVALGGLRRFNKAIGAFDKAIEVNPQNSWAWVNKGNSLIALGEYDEALKAYDKATEINPQDSQASVPWHLKGLALSRLGKYDEAIKAFDKTIKINPQDSQAWHDKESTLIKLNQSNEVINTSVVDHNYQHGGMKYGGFNHGGMHHGDRWDLSRNPVTLVKIAIIDVPIQLAQNISLTLNTLFVTSTQ